MSTLSHFEPFLIHFFKASCTLSEIPFFKGAPARLFRDVKSAVASV